MPTVLVVLVLLASYLIVGHQLFDRDHGDQLRHADAIVVLGGEHDGREQYGIDLARQATPTPSCCPTRTTAAGPITTATKR